jgi:cobalamin synthase
MSSGSTEMIEEVSKWTVGLGILTLALAPLSLPFLILTAVALIPFVVPLLVAAVAVALVTLPVLLIRAVVRRAFGGVSSEAASPVHGRRGDSRLAEAGW